MIESKPTKFLPGQWVIIPSNYKPIRAKVLGIVGPFAPGGVMVYLVRFGSKPKYTRAEVREDQLEPEPPKAPKEPTVDNVPTDSAVLASP